MQNGESSYRRFLAGDDEAINDIIDEYCDGLVLFLNGIVHDVELAQELAQDTFVKLFLKRPKNKFKASFKTWLYSIGRNVAIDYLRKRGRNQTVPIEEAEGAAGFESVEEKVLNEQTKKDIYCALEKLKPEYAQVLWLTYFEGLSNKESAIVMKKSVHGVENLIGRARKALKIELEKGGAYHKNAR